MNPCLSSPPQTPVTLTSPVLFPTHTDSSPPIRDSNTTVGSTPTTNSNTPLSFGQPPAPPTPPCVSDPVFTYDHMYSNVENPPSSISVESAAQAQAPQRTPNVYINGLPPHFPEQELFALARPYGEVKSVRTFTRHISEKPTGYGFVLFERVDSAERCIEGLRKYRNLHPSFSKQVHRIPGTVYAQHNSSYAGEHDETTFKARMEKLQDETSTNLYIEGLPLSIDEESLSALMLPYKIKSSRFFKTKLSDPPRIIAFVRLETRAAAEETIERLHGRMVRGWNDPGCRISVRFADSAEQRELRRAERSLRNGDQSPARLTIAQAALLNLRGKELQAHGRKFPLGQRHHVTDSQSCRSLSDQHPSIARTTGFGSLSGSASCPTNLRNHHDESSILPTHDLPVNTANMDTLIQAIQNMDYRDELFDSSFGYANLKNRYHAVQQAQLQALANASLLSPSTRLPPVPFRGQTHAHNGFTPAEELIIQAHAQMQLQAHMSSYSPVFDQDVPLCPSSVINDPHNVRTTIDANISPSNAASSGFARPAISRASVGPSAMRFSHDILTTISEGGLRTMSQQPPPLASTAQAQFPSSSAADASLMRSSSRAVSIVPPPENHDNNGRPKERQHRVVHPSDSVSSAFQTAPTNKQSSLYEDKTQQSYSPTHIPSRGTRGNASVISSNSSVDLKQRDCSHGPILCGRNNKDCGTLFCTSVLTHHDHAQNSPSSVGELQSGMNEHTKSPVVFSPALTYSSRTPSTLSPATPFFGSFINAQDTFDVVMVENEEGGEKLKSKTGTK